MQILLQAVSMVKACTTLEIFGISVIDLDAWILKKLPITPKAMLEFP